MMESKVPEISFALMGITTEHFSVEEDGFSEKGSITIGTSIRFGTGQKQRIISCFTGFIFESDKKPFITVEAGCHFQIADESWAQMVDKESGTLKVSRTLLTHLAMLTVGTTRGILHAKTENTRFNEFFLPAVNVSAMIKNDLLFESVKPRGKKSG